MGTADGPALGDADGYVEGLSVGKSVASPLVSVLPCVGSRTAIPVSSSPRGSSNPVEMGPSSHAQPKRI